MFKYQMNNDVCITCENCNKEYRVDILQRIDSIDLCPNCSYPLNIGELNNERRNAEYGSSYNRRSFR